MIMNDFRDCEVLLGRSRPCGKPTLRQAWVWLAMAITLPANAGILISETIPVGTAIPDDSSSGVQSTHTVTAVPASITGLTVTLSIDPVAGQSAFLGDLYAYLRHGDAIAVLLNRPGRRLGETAGYDDDQSLSVTFSDVGTDIHSYRTVDTAPLVGALNGVYAPDGRLTDPDSVLVTDARSNGLSVFAGADPSGDWVLFISDLSGGGAHEFVSWGMEMTATEVPEPQVWVLAAGLCGWVGWRRIRGRKSAR